MCSSLFCEGIRAFSFMWFGSVYSSLLIPTRLIIRTCSRSDKDGRFEGSSAVFIHYPFYCGSCVSCVPFSSVVHLLYGAVGHHQQF